MGYPSSFELFSNLDFFNPETGEWELPKSATDEQKTVYLEHLEIIGNSFVESKAREPLSADDAKNALEALMEGKSLEERKKVLEELRLGLEPIFGVDIDEVFTQLLAV